MSERDIFVAFAREHSKYIYFLLTAAAAATGYALDQIGEAQTLALRHGFLGLAVAAWMYSFWTGCRRLIKMLAGLHEVAQLESPLVPTAVTHAGSSAKCQLGSFILGVVVVRLVGSGESPCSLITTRRSGSRQRSLTWFGELRRGPKVNGGRLPSILEG